MKVKYLSHIAGMLILLPAQMARCQIAGHVIQLALIPDFYFRLNIMFLEHFSLQYLLQMTPLPFMKNLEKHIFKHTHEST